MSNLKIAQYVFSCTLFGLLVAENVQNLQSSTENLEIINSENFQHQTLDQINGQEIHEIFNFAKHVIEKSQNLSDGSLNLLCQSYLIQPSPLIQGHLGTVNQTTNTGLQELSSTKWMVGLASGLAITLCSVCGVILIPMTQKLWYKHFLLYLIATATASLVGNSLFHLYPSVFLEGEHMSDWTNLSRAMSCY